MLSVAIRVELIQKFYSSFVLWVSLLEKTLLLGFPKGPFIKVDFQWEVDNSLFNLSMLLAREFWML